MSFPSSQPQPTFPAGPGADGGLPTIQGNQPLAEPYAPPPVHGYAPLYPAPAGPPPAFPTAAPGGYSSYQAQLPQELHYLGATVPNFNVTSAIPSLPGFDPNEATDAIRKATKGFGCDDEKLMATILTLSPLKMDAVSKNFESKIGKNLSKVLDSETSGSFKMGIHGLASGPVIWDAELLFKAMDGIGTNEEVLTEILFGRTNEEIHMLKDAFRYKFGKDLAQMVRSDLSGKTERLFIMALSGQRTPDLVPVDKVSVDKDVEALYNASQGRSGTDEMVFCDIMVNRSQPHLSAVIEAYNRKYRSLTKVIKSEFSGHMRAAFLHIAHGAKPKRDGQGIWRDAKLIYQSMQGIGCNEEQLTRRLIRAHWNPARMDAIKRAFKDRTRKDLEAKVKSETSGSHKKLLIAIVNGQHKL